MWKGIYCLLTKLQHQVGNTSSTKNKPNQFHCVRFDIHLRKNRLTYGIPNDPL